MGKGDASAVYQLTYNRKRDKAETVLWVRLPLFVFLFYMFGCMHHPVSGDMEWIRQYFGYCDFSPGSMEYVG